MRSRVIKGRGDVGSLNEDSLPGNQPTGGGVKLILRPYPIRVQKEKRELNGVCKFLLYAPMFHSIIPRATNIVRWAAGGYSPRHFHSHENDFAVLPQFFSVSLFLRDESPLSRLCRAPIQPQLHR